MTTEARVYCDHDHRTPLAARTASFLQLAKGFFRDLTTPYRPEQHYMRGPGPKWRAKHGLQQRAN